ncbi:hypothetical protein [Geothrix alkalitolerans]|uniref:hypothetical protein n=1 Tax=Geothrix alkalitolerans TaxID=2922724 RepID=UPI001FAF0E7E|nr:hypothetical protein [Geothrix alkalitolerans]
MWRTFTDADLDRRVEPRTRTLREQVVHQCVGEDSWMRRMLGIDTGLPPLPAKECSEPFIHHYGAATAARPGPRRGSR